MAKKQIAAIDVGSHSIQMKLGEVSRKGEFRELEHFYKTTTLGRDTFTGGKISFTSLEKLCELLEVFAQVMKDYQVSYYKAVATSALREAGNKDYIIDQVKHKTGIDIRVISNSEEQFYHHRAIKSGIKDINQILAENTLLIALGAGSVQITAYHDQTLHSTQNIKIGALRLRKVFGMLENELLDYQTVIEEYIKANLDSIEIFKEKTTYKNLIVVGGEIDLLNRIQKNYLKKNDSSLDRAGFQDLYQRIMEQSVVDLAGLYDLAYDRVEIIHPILMLLDNVMKQVGTETIILSELGLNDGVLDELHEEIYSLTSKAAYSEDILENVRAVARRFYYHEKHQGAVEEYGNFLFQKTKRIHGMKEESLLLQAAIILQNVGKAINQNNYFNHSYHIIRSLEIFGLSEREVNIIANVAGYQPDYRTELLDHIYRLLPQADRILISRLAAILGLANALDRSHQKKYKLGVIHAKNNELILTATTDFMTNTRLEEWDFKEKAKFFKEVFGITPILKIKKEYK